MRRKRLGRPKTYALQAAISGRKTVTRENPLPTKNSGFDSPFLPMASMNQKCISAQKSEHIFYVQVSGSQHATATITSRAENSAPTTGRPPARAMAGKKLNTPAVQSDIRLQGKGAEWLSLLRMKGTQDAEL